RADGTLASRARADRATRLRAPFRGRTSSFSERDQPELARAPTPQWWAPSAPTVKQDDRSESGPPRPVITVPRDRAQESVLEIDVRTKAEEPLRLLHVRNAQLDIGELPVDEADLALALREPHDQARELVDRHGAPRISDVERLADRRL